MGSLALCFQDAEDAASSILSPAASTSQQSPPQPSLEHALPAGILPADLADFLKFSSDEYNSDEAAELALKFLSVPEPAGVAALGATQWGSFRNKLGSVLSGSSDDEVRSSLTSPSHVTGCELAGPIRDSPGLRRDSYPLAHTTHKRPSLM